VHDLGLAGMNRAVTSDAAPVGGQAPHHAVTPASAMRLTALVVTLRRVRGGRVVSENCDKRIDQALQESRTLESTRSSAADAPIE
jgi:hypothetical protein